MPTCTLLSLATAQLHSGQLQSEWRKSVCVCARCVLQIDAYKPPPPSAARFQRRTRPAPGPTFACCSPASGIPPCMHFLLDLACIWRGLGVTEHVANTCPTGSRGVAIVGFNDLHFTTEQDLDGQDGGKILSVRSIGQKYRVCQDLHLDGGPVAIRQGHRRRPPQMRSTVASIPKAAYNALQASYRPLSRPSIAGHARQSVSHRTRPHVAELQPLRARDSDAAAAAEEPSARRSFRAPPSSIHHKGVHTARLTRLHGTSNPSMLVRQ